MGFRHARAYDSLGAIIYFLIIAYRALPVVMGPFNDAVNLVVLILIFVDCFRLRFLFVYAFMGAGHVAIAAMAIIIPIMDALKPAGGTYAIIVNMTACILPADGAYAVRLG